jgi:hypothetical protein
VAFAEEGYEIERVQPQRGHVRRGRNERFP